jgi:hypothetical protein
VPGEEEGGGEGAPVRQGNRRWDMERRWERGEELGRGVG